MSKFRKDRSELEVELAERLEAMRAAAETYDDGKRWAAKDLSNHLYVLLHDGTGRTRSLLGLVGRKKGLKLVSSTQLEPERPGQETIAVSAPLLVSMRVSGEGVHYRPKFDGNQDSKPYEWLPFSRWYDEPVFHPMSGMRPTRRNMIFTMRSQDGGAHVDDAITDEHYWRFDKEGDPNIRYLIQEGGKVALTFGRIGTPIPYGTRATIRQIAWEVDSSLRRIGL